MFACRHYYLLFNSAVLIGPMASSTKNVFPHRPHVLRFCSIYCRLAHNPQPGGPGATMYLCLSLDLSLDPTKSLWLRQVIRESRFLHQA
jgi:hypothetical protein